MKKTNLFFVSALLCMFFCAVEAGAQKFPKKGYESITEERSRNIIGFLASDLLQGRDAGAPGGKIAAEYIVSLLREWGVEPFLESGYYQNFAAAKNGNNWITEADFDLSGLIETGCDNRIMSNILAAIPGTGEGYVVVGAHYDHLGVDPSLEGDTCYNGADDNASGVSAVLQIARAIKMSGKKPRRTIIFALWDGEEKWLLGSRFFVKKCTVLPEISAYMNFDMIGRGPAERPEHLSYIYSAGNPLFGEWMKSDVKKHDFSFVPFYNASDNLIGGSDNTPFAQKNIPIVWYHTEGHPDYHRPSDSAEKINYGKLTDIARAACLCVWRLATVKKY
ncbi:MAG: M20/M25/M40 family metallo-hydrolase [Bacteroidaceae bacterium]|nr:M20/M25/M40 family metallo-hydrolase [Bacteroidaceae bacterium]